MALPSIPTPQTIGMSSAKITFGSLALTNYYLVGFNGMTPVDGESDGLKNHLKTYYGIEEDWITRDVGILCADANLPSSTFATAEVKDNFIGVPQEFAHSRLFTDIDFTFYVDTDYKVLRFFEGWMDFISGASEVAQIDREEGLKPGYYRRFQYPNSYKIDNLSITKFERSLGSLESSYRLDYRFVHAFPKGITSIPVSYGSADLLKVTVTFNYDRYVVSRSSVEGIRPTTTSNDSSYSSGLDSPVLQDIDGQTLPYGTGIPGLTGAQNPAVA
jgi:hypothetical protein